MILYADLTDEQRAAVDSDNSVDRYQAAVAGWGLDKLVYDSDAPILANVAVQEYGLDLLIKNPSKGVRNVVEAVLESNNQTFYEWIADNPDKCALPDNRETGETIRTPFGPFYVADMTRAQIEAAGYSLHHESDDGSYLIMTNGKNSAFAIAANQTSPEQSQKAKTVDIPAAKVQADSRTSLNQDATQLTTPTKEQTQSAKVVR